MKSLVILPAYNEEQEIAKVLQKLKKLRFDRVLVVDDGSTDRTVERAKSAGAMVVSHCQNCGVGAATQTGIEWGLKNDFEQFFTIDADGQQSVSDLLIIQKALKTKPCVIGSRFLQKNKIPLFRFVANKIANGLTGIFFGVWVTDSQSGLRGFSREVAEKLNLRANGFEYCSEFVREVLYAGFELVEVPISVKYTKASMAKGQNFSEGIKTFGKLFLRALSR